MITGFSGFYLYVGCGVLTASSYRPVGGGGGRRKRAGWAGFLGSGKKRRFNFCGEFSLMSESWTDGKKGLPCPDPSEEKNDLFRFCSIFLYLKTESWNRAGKKHTWYILGIFLKRLGGDSLDRLKVGSGTEKTVL